MPTAKELIAQMEGNLVHASLKTGNSNAPAGGIRLAVEQAVDIPYVCARSHLADPAVPDADRGLDLDYIVNNDWFKLMRVCLGEEVSNPPSVTLTKDEKAQIKELYTKMAKGLMSEELGLESASMRLKQLLLPKGDDYVAVTPITVTGHAKRVMEEHKRRRDARKEIGQAVDIGSIPWVKSFSIGGANSQNAGARIFGAFTAPLVFDNTPIMEGEISEAFRIAYKGIRLKIPRQMVGAYKSFLTRLHQEALDAGRQKIKWTTELKNQEYPYLKAIWNALEKQAEKAARILSENMDRLPDPLPCLERSPEMEGWLNRNARTTKWRDTQSRWFANRVAAYRLGTESDGTPSTVGLDDKDIRRIAAAIRAGEQ